jgi:sulfur carrier protein ThiS
MRISIESKNQTRSIKFEGTGRALCKKLGINPETVLVLKNRTLVSDDEKLVDSDEVKLLSVVSGG